MVFRMISFQNCLETWLNVLYHVISIIKTKNKKAFARFVLYSREKVHFALCSHWWITVASHVTVILYVKHWPIVAFMQMWFKDVAGT